MTIPAELKHILTQNGNTITTAEANAAGISNERLRQLVKRGVLERPAFGIYVLPHDFVDRMYATQQRRPKIIYSHETALFLHDLTDRDPISYSVTVPTGYNTVKLREEGFTVYTIKRDLHTVETTEAETMFGHTVRVYTMERTICDCLRRRSRMELTLLIDALRRYTRRKSKHVTTLMIMPTTFRVEQPPRHSMEVLL